jgi:hypothetical protein
MNRKTFLQNLLISSILGGIFVFSYFLTPDPRGYGTHEHLFLPPCYFQFFFHIPCPACGLTTSFALLAKGEWQQAFHLHWMSPILFLIFAFLFIYSNLCLLFRKSFWNLFENKWTPYLSSFIILGMLTSWLIKLVYNDTHSFAIRSFF